MSDNKSEEKPKTPEELETEEKGKAARAVALNKVYRHYFFTCCQTVMPFSQKTNVMMQLDSLGGNVNKVAVLAASMSSASGVIEFIICPFLGKLSDANGRQTFMSLGPLADMVTYGMVWANPCVETLWLQAIAGTPMNTFAGTTCAGASIMDIYGDAPWEMGAAFGGLLTPIGAGLIVGPLVGQAMVKLGGGRPEMAYLGAAGCAALQYLNVVSMGDTLPKEKRSPFAFSLADINPISFIKLFMMKGQSTLAKLSLMAGFLQKADEGKNLAGLNQVYALKDVGMSEDARGNFVSFIGGCVLLSARLSNFTLEKLGGSGHTSFSNFVCIASMVFFAFVPQWFKSSANNWWPMFAGLLFSSAGWNADTYVKQQGVKHAEAAGIGNGEYSAMLANMRSVMSSLAPTLYAQVYAWSTSGGRSMPGLAYLLAAVFKIVAEFLYQTMSAKSIENPPAKQ